MDAAPREYRSEGQATGFRREAYPLAGHHGNGANIAALLASALLHRIRAPDDPGPAIALLEEALTIASAMGDAAGIADLCILLAQVYEAGGDLATASAYECRARSQLPKGAVTDRPHRLLEQRADSVWEGAGRLEGDGLFQTLYRHVADLLPVDCFYIGLLDAPAQRIDICFRMEGGTRLPTRQVALASSHLSARCLRENEEMLVHWDGALWSQVVPGTQPIRTVLLRPLNLGDRVLGVICVQSVRPDAYGPDELMIFRALCTSAAIALGHS